MMKNTELNTILINSYFDLFQRLSSEAKQALISKLTKSMRNEEKEQTTPFFSTFGAFEDDKTAQELISEIEDSRTFNKNTAEL
jgi:hypothetical protein